MYHLVSNMVRAWFDVWASLVILTLSTVSAQDTQYCYSCSSKSALCRESVYDGQYLSITACRTKCFLRTEGQLMYRGCFDNWLNGLVRHDYEGCSTQEYLGQQVEWCFCRGSGNKQKAPCNGAPRDVIARISSQVSSQLEVPRMDRYAKSAHDTYYLPMKASSYDPKGGFEIDVQYDDSTSAPKQSNGQEKQIMEAVHDMYGEEVPKFNCYSCHDESPFCKTEITDPTTIATSPCRSKCFVRYENDKTYRGCFDGWLSTELDFEYHGCRQQVYLDEKVEWCLCEAELCNGRSMSAMEKGEVGAMVLTTKQPYYKRQMAEAAAAVAAGMSVTEHVAGYGTAGSGSQRMFTWQQRDNVGYGFRQKYDKSSPPRSTLGGTTGLCRGYYNGIYPDPTDCGRFIQCFNGYTYRRRCPRGTLYSRSLARCDYPSAVGYDCAGGGYKAESQEAETNEEVAAGKEQQPAIGYN